MLNSEDIKKLAILSRIEVSEKEIETVAKEIDSILSYVGEIKNAVANSEVEDVHYKTINVFREDVLLPPKTSPDDLVICAPDNEGGYIKVKKIL